MAINNKELGKIGTFGAIAGLVTPLIMTYLVMPVLNFLAGVVPAVSLKLSNPTISVSVRESLTGVNTGLAGKLSAWVADALGLTATIPFETYVFGAIGGALLFIAGAYVADMLGLLKNSAKKKTATNVFVGNIVAGLIIGGLAVPTIGIDMLNAVIAMLINAVVIAYVLVPIVGAINKKLVPF